MCKDELIAEGAWSFDKEVTDVFSDMLERSIPDYETMRDLVYRVGRNFLNPLGVVADLGCSTGLCAEPFVKANNGRNTFVLSDVSQPMLDECRKRYENDIRQGFVSVVCHDLRCGMPKSNVTLALCCLTLQFIPIEYRQYILQSIYDNLQEGGALILVEKVLGNSAVLDGCFTREYLDLKRENSYTEEQISAKRKSLEGVLVPLSAEMNMSMLREAGFRRIDCFWRYLNFAAWVAVKK